MRVEFNTSNDSCMTQRFKHREFVGTYSRMALITVAFFDFDNAVRLKALTLSSRS
jgi:hypothetical protein